MKRIVAALFCVGLALSAYSSVALGPTANPAEALDEAACVGLPLTEFKIGDQPVAIHEAKMVPRDGELPSHCWILAQIKEGAVIEVRLPVAPWTDVLVVSTHEQRNALSHGDAVASGDAPSSLVENLGREIARTYYGRDPKRVER